MKISNVDISKDSYNFPFYFDSYEDFGRYLTERNLDIPEEFILDRKEDLVELSYTNTWEKVQVEKNIDSDPYYDDVTYILNKYGLRGSRTIDDIDSNSIVTAGCSNTFGMGSYQKDIWPTLAFGDEVINIGQNGLGPSTIFRTLTNLLDFKVPKAIAILMSTIDRMEYIGNLASKDKSTIQEFTLAPGIIKNSIGKDERQKLYIDFLTAINEPMSHSYFHTGLEMLVHKCANKGVALSIGSWNPLTEKILYKYSYKGYSVPRSPRMNGKFPLSRDIHHRGKEYHQQVAKLFREAMGLYPIY